MKLSRIKRFVLLNLRIFMLWALLGVAAYCMGGKFWLGVVALALWLINVLG